MDNSTPFGQLSIETLDSVAPRLISFTSNLIDLLTACGIKVETTTAYLLNSTYHPISVPCALNGIPIEMNFCASLPSWALTPRARLMVSFNYGKRYYYLESKRQQFLISRILKRFLSEIKTEERKQRLQAEKNQKETKARESFLALSETLGLYPTDDPNILQKDGLKILCLPQTPTKVTLTVTLPHDQIIEIVSKFIKK